MFSKSYKIFFNETTAFQDLHMAGFVCYAS